MENQLQIVSFNQAERLEKLGFNWETNQFYNKKGELKDSVWLNHNHFMFRDNYSAPTVALALKWFRDVKGITGFCDNNYHGWFFEYYSIGCDYIKYDSRDLFLYFDTYEYAELALLDELLNLLENKKDEQSD